MTAESAGQTAVDRADGTAVGGVPPGPGSTRHWAPGTRVLWRYRGNGTDAPHICRPVTVVTDTPELLAVWLAPGTECVRPELADGTPVHLEPLETRYIKPRRTVRCRWTGSGVLKLARPGEPWSVWIFRDPEGVFRNWYMNLEEPRTRWRGGVDSEDHFLDLSVAPDRSVEWHDEDEFAAARRAGLVDDALARRVRAAGRAAVERIAAWGPPFCDGWEHWRPDPRWPVPSLPDDWHGSPPPGGVTP